MIKILHFLFLLMLVPSLCFGGASRDFDGVSDSSDNTKPSALIIGTDSFTRIAWAYWTQGADIDEEVIFSQQDGTGLGRNWLSIDDDASACTADFIGSFLGNVATCGALMSQNIWTHVAVRSDEAGGTVQLIQNGTQTGSATRTVEAATGTLRTGVHKTNTTQDFEGQIAHSILCEGAITNAQINEISINPEVAASAYCGSGYDINNPLWGTSSPEEDISGNALTGTLTGTSASSNGPPVMFGVGLPL